MYIMCACVFSALSCRAVALQISIIIILYLQVDELQTNDNQDLTIHDLEKEIADCKELFLKNLEYDITSLDEMQDEANDKIHDLGAFVASRKCR